MKATKVKKPAGVPLMMKIELVLRIWLVLEETREKQFRAPRSMLKLAEQCLDGLDKLREARDQVPAGQAPSCRTCGCTDEKACEGGCYWVVPGLCSRCGERLEREKRARLDEDAVTRSLLRTQLRKKLLAESAARSKR